MSVDTVWCKFLIETRAGSRREARSRDSTLEVIVAENRYVWRSLGRTLRILSITAPKSKSQYQYWPCLGSAKEIPRSNIRSASSTTRYFKLLRLKPFVFSRWSMIDSANREIREEHAVRNRCESVVLVSYPGDGRELRPRYEASLIGQYFGPSCPYRYTIVNI